MYSIDSSVMFSNIIPTEVCLRLKYSKGFIISWGYLKKKQPWDSIFNSENHEWAGFLKALPTLINHNRALMHKCLPAS